MGGWVTCELWKDRLVGRVVKGKRKLEVKDVD